MTKLATMLLLAAGCSTVRPVDDTRRCDGGDCATVHEPDIVATHPALVVSLNYDLSQCQHCHGDDFSGGLAQKSCLTCHARGPTACDTCHGQPPSSGAHGPHSRFDCTSCHPKPATWDEPGHLGPLRVSFFDGARCSGTYCHGDATPAWYGGPKEAACGSCHGNPPANHANPRCNECHPSDPAKHVDGKVELGDGSGTCTACHALPPATGAHVSHTSATHRLSKPLGCGECHFVPAAVEDQGHIDHDHAIEFPPGTSALARTAGSMPAFDGAGCNNTWCHLSATPGWNDGSRASECGACHGIPPSDSAHAPTLGLGDCCRCHRTVDARGTLHPETHINGIVDGP